MTFIMLVRFLQARGNTASGEQSSFLRPVLHCRMCNRDDIHLFGLRRSRALFIYTVIYTFGLILWFGPYHCICCGHRRWTRFEWVRKLGRKQTLSKS